MTDRPKKLYQQVADKIIKAIEEGEYQLGNRLPSERDLATTLQVSRPTIREAIIALEIRNWVSSKHGSGVYVVDKLPTDPTEPELDIGPFELMEARRMLEGEAVALATATITEEEITRLEGIVKVMDRHRNSREGENADGEFHVLIAESTRNTAIANIVEQLWDLRYKSPLCVNIFTRATQGGLQQPITDHYVIIDALKQRDAAAARAAMHAHLDNVVDRILEATELEAIDNTRRQIAAKRDEVLRRVQVSQAQA